MSKSINCCEISNPFSMFDSLFNEALSLGYSAPNKVSNLVCSSNYPPADIYEVDGDLNIDLAVAGWKKEEISLDYNDNYVTVTLKKEAEDEKKNNKEKVVVLQRGIKQVDEASVSYFIDPTKYDANEISCSMKDGILTITVKRDVKLPKQRTLELK